MVVIIEFTWSGIHCPAVVKAVMLDQRQHKQYRRSRHHHGHKTHPSTIPSAMLCGVCTDIQRPHDIHQKDEDDDNDNEEEQAMSCLILPNSVVVYGGMKS
jgi:hypothetical protein